MSSATKPTYPLSNTNRAILAFCASHIDSDERLSRLPLMLQSWKNQIVPVTLFLSISVGSDEFRRKVEELCSRFGNNLKVIVSSIKHTQFQHYAALAASVTEALNSPTSNHLGLDVRECWILFSDDDDVWHPSRTAAFAHVLRTMEPKQYPIVPCVQENPSAALNSHVSKQLGVAVADLGADREYYHYMVRFTVLLDFFNQACDTPDLMKHPFCDCFLVKYLQNVQHDPSTALRTLAFVPKQPLYSSYENPSAQYSRNRISPYSKLSAAYEAKLASEAPGSETWKKVHNLLTRQRLTADFCMFSMVYWPAVENAHGRVYGQPSWECFNESTQLLHAVRSKLTGQKPSSAPRYDLSVKPVFEDMLANNAEWKMFVNSPPLTKLMTL